MKKIKLINDGNFSRWVRWVLILIGFAMMYGAFRFIPPSFLGGGIALAGFGVTLVGGFTSRAAMLKIKPFDNSYKKARDSYKVKGDEQDQSK